MNSTIRNIMAVLAGITVGMVVNMGLIIGGASVIPAPAGVDVTNAESIAASLDLFQTRHYIFPFLAHALGTLVGAFVVALAAASQHRLLALLVGFFFLIGGIAASFMIPAPTGFILLDILTAYIPMSLLGWFIADALRKPGLPDLKG